MLRPYVTPFLKLSSKFHMTIAKSILEQKSLSSQVKYVRVFKPLPLRYQPINPNKILLNSRYERTI